MSDLLREMHAFVTFAAFARPADWAARRDRLVAGSPAPLVDPEGRSPRGRDDRTPTARDGELGFRG